MVRTSAITDRANLSLPSSLQPLFYPPINYCPNMKANPRVDKIESDQITQQTRSMLENPALSPTKSPEPSKLIFKCPLII